jgi:ribose transport system substrate-binding protein
MGAEPEVRAEMRENGTRLIGSVAFFPERYGEAIVRIATDVLLGKSTTPAAFSAHQLVTPENVNRLYPNDALFVQMAREYD